MQERIPKPVAVECNIYSAGPITPEVGKLALLCHKASVDFFDELRSRGGAAPGEFPAWDDAAWERLQHKVGRCQCGDEPREDCPIGPYMLMHHEGPDKAGFKHCETRQYTYA